MPNRLHPDRNSNSPKTQELGCEDMGARRNGVPQIADSEGQLATSHWTHPYEGGQYKMATLGIYVQKRKPHYFRCIFFDGQLESQSRCRQSCLLDKWGRDVVFLGGVHFQTIKGPHAGHFGRGPRWFGILNFYCKIAIFCNIWEIHDGFGIFGWNPVMFLIWIGFCGLSLWNAICAGYNRIC